MSTVNRQTFVKTLDKGGINVNDMDAKTQEKLKKAGISQKELVEIAGKDGKISGSEYSRLFNLIDRSDRNGSSKSINTTDKGVQTQSGAAYEALQQEVDRNLAKAKTQGVIHLGMREASSKEADALAKANPAANGGVVRIEAYRSEGVISYGGNSYDLKTSTDLEKFRDALTTGPDKMSIGRAQKFADQLATVKAEARDEMAQLGMSLYKAGREELPVNRLVLSGHGDPNGTVMGDDPGYLRLADFESLSKVFPEGAGKIEHVAVSACFTASQASFEDLKRTFPNLKSAFAYNGFSPLAETSAPAHLRKWESLTDGNDPSQVDPMFRKTATWNVADGMQGLRKMSLDQAEVIVKAAAFAHEEYKSGKKDPSKATNDLHLDSYYVALAELQRHPEVSAMRKAEVDAIRREVLKLRHPELSM